MVEILSPFVMLMLSLLGCGKSTLLRLVMGMEKPISGTIELGSYHVHANYFEQNQAEALDLHLTPLSTLIQAVSEGFDYY